MKKKNSVTKKELAKFKYGIIAASQSAEDELNGTFKIFHLCAYTKKPTQKDYEELKKELNTDPEFNLVGRIGVDIFLMEATPEMVNITLKALYE